jgi:hypothetical protein
MRTVATAELSTDAVATRAAQAALPPPRHLEEWQQHASQRAACYQLDDRDGAARQTSLPWHTASCDATSAAHLAPSHTLTHTHTHTHMVNPIAAGGRGTTSLYAAAHVASTNVNKAAVLHAAGCTAVDAPNYLSCPRTYRLPRSTPAAHATVQPALAESDLPAIWTYCANSVAVASGGGQPSGTTKASPGVNAFHPGATLLLPLETDWLGTSTSAAHVPTPSEHASRSSAGVQTPSERAGRSEGHGAANTTRRTAFNVTLQYLTSWSGMGVVRIGCVYECVCEPRELNGHVRAAAAHGIRLSCVERSAPPPPRAHHLLTCSPSADCLLTFLTLIIFSPSGSAGCYSAAPAPHAATARPPLGRALLA